MTPKGLAKLIVNNSIHGISIDAQMGQLFPDFNTFFVSESEVVALKFCKQYLPDTRLEVELSTGEVKIFRDERIPGVGLYPHQVGYASVHNNLAASILAAGLFAYDYLSS